MKRDLVRNLLLGVAFFVAAFFWIWLYRFIGAKAFWVTLIAFGIYLAGGAVPRKLPWMTLGGVLGVVGGFLAYALAMLILPMYSPVSIAIAGAVFVLVGALASVARLPEMFPSYLLGLAGFLGAMDRFVYLFEENAVEAMPRALGTFFGVMLSLLFGLLLGLLLGTPILKLGREGEGGVLASEKQE